MRSSASEPSFIAFVQDASSSTGSSRKRKSTLAVMSERTVSRVWACGAIASQAAWSNCSGAQLACGARSQGPHASVKSFTSRRRMWSALIASAFFRSKRAGLALTSATSNFATISSIEKTSWSAEKDQPSSER